MAYIGNIPAEKFTSVDIQNFSVSATANYTLDRPVANENEIELFINNVRQHPGSGKAYTASGTALTLSEATAGTDTMYCVYQGKARQTVTPATSSVTNAMLAGSIDLTSKVTGALPQANIADQAINEAKLQVSNSPTNGYMLTAQSGNTGGLTWAEASSSNPTHIQRVTNSSDVTSITVTNCFSASYDIYKIIFYLSSTQANMPMSLRFRKNTSDDFTGANLDGNLIGARGTTTGTAFVNGGVASSTYLHLAHHDIYSGASSGLLGELTIANAYNRSDGRMHIKYQGVGDGASGIENFDGAWVYSGTEIATGFQLFSATSSARFNFSEINIYGYNQ